MNTKELKAQIESKIEAIKRDIKITKNTTVSTLDETIKKEKRIEHLDGEQRAWEEYKRKGETTCYTK